MNQENILIINICKEKLHYYEFVKPIEDILRNIKVKFFTIPYKNLKKKDLIKSSRVIICGTSLADNEFVKDIDKFKWILDYKKPVLGICGGMQLIGLVFGGKLKRRTEIGYYKEKFDGEFLGLLDEQKVYHLHNYYIDFNLKEFEVYCFSDRVVNKVGQAVRHKQKPIYGVLFHPEVRQKELIDNFCRLSFT